MADLASRSFKEGGSGNYNLSDTDFLTKFNAVFPLTQGALWHRHILSDKLCSLVFSGLQQQQQPMGSWLRLPKGAASSGEIGPTFSHSSESTTPSSPTSASQNSSLLSKPLPIGYEVATQDGKIELALSEYNKRWQPLPRPSTWLTNPAPRTMTRAGPCTGPPLPNK